MSRILRAYHDRTKHSFESVRLGGRGLDWENEPSKLKRYPDLEPEPLPPVEPTGVPWWEALSGSARPDGGVPLDRSRLSHLLFHAAGVVRTARTLGGTLHLRTYACAGALYPIEVYVVAGEMEGLDAGVYHYAPEAHGLHRLREGDARGALGLAEPPGTATLILSGTPWRTAWKYGPRGFRHLYWDAGMMLANLLAAAAALGLRARLALGFVDADADAVLGLDGSSEFSLCAVPVGGGDAPPSEEPAPPEHRVEPLSPRPGEDPLISEARQALRLEDGRAVTRYRGADIEVSSEQEEGEVVEVAPLRPERLSGDFFEQVVRRRGSSRRLAREPMPAAEYATILDLALAGIPADWPAGTGGMRADVAAHALEGVPVGGYRYLGRGRFRRVREGSLRQEAGFVCLEQSLGADAAATTFLAADLDAYLQGLGGRGYAAAQLEAAVAAGRIYLGAYAQCLGASGLTFYDDEVRRLLATGWEPMMTVVTGPEGHRASIRRCRPERAPVGGSGGEPG